MHRPTGRARAPLAVVTVGWVALLGAIARRSLFLTTDMVSNHVHVWWIAHNVWSGRGIPLRMPVLASGRAWTFPYASVPWTLAAVAWPLGGDHVVTATLVVGAAGVIAATFWALPKVRTGWWACATLANPALIAAVLLGQLPFLWSAAFLLCALGAWRHRRVRRATLLAIVAQVIHPAVAVPIAALLVLTALPHEAQRSRLLACWALSLAAALPAAALTLAAPVVHQTSAFTAVYQLVTTVTVRAMVIVLPVLYAQLAARPHRRIGPLVTIVSVGLLAPMWRPFLLADGWHALWRPRPTTLDSFVASRAFTPGRIDRVLDAGDGKYGIYQVLRAGASLDSEPFPESLHREGFASDNAYATFLAERRVDTVVVTTSYADTFHSNEPEHLKSLAARGACVAHITVRLADTAPGWQTYDITHGCGSP